MPEQPDDPDQWSAIEEREDAIAHGDFVPRVPMQPEQPEVWFATADVEAARQRLADNRYGGPRDLHDLDGDDIAEIIRLVLTATWQRARQEGIAEGRKLAAETLRAAAAGRRTYSTTSHAYSELLEAEAVLLDHAADAAAGDLKPLYGWLPSWQWTDEMNAALNAAGGSDA